MGKNKVEHKLWLPLTDFRLRKEQPSDTWDLQAKRIYMYLFVSNLCKY